MCEYMSTLIMMGRTDVVPLASDQSSSKIELPTGLLRNVAIGASPTGTRWTPILRDWLRLQPWSNRACSTLREPTLCLFDLAAIDLLGSEC